MGLDLPWTQEKVLGELDGLGLEISHGLFVNVRGRGGHGSTPYRGRDPIAAMAEMVTALQTMVTRRFDVFDPVVVTVEGGASPKQRGAARVQ